MSSPTPWERKLRSAVGNWAAAFADPDLLPLPGDAAEAAAWAKVVAAAEASPPVGGERARLVEVVTGSRPDPDKHIIHPSETLVLEDVAPGRYLVEVDGDGTTWWPTRLTVADALEDGPAQGIRLGEPTTPPTSADEHWEPAPPQYEKTTVRARVTGTVDVVIPPIDDATEVEQAHVAGFGLGRAQGRHDVPEGATLDGDFLMVSEGGERFRYGTDDTYVYRERVAVDGNWPAGALKLGPVRYVLARAAEGS